MLCELNYYIKVKNQWGLVAYVIMQHRISTALCDLLEKNLILCFLCCSPAPCRFQPAFGVLARAADGAGVWLSQEQFEVGVWGLSWWVQPWCPPPIPAEIVPTHTGLPRPKAGRCF